MGYETVLFDLDGTLLDTLEDLQASVNYIMRKCGFPLRTLEEVRGFVGGGATKLMHRVLEGRVPPEREAELQTEYRAWYLEHNCVKTHLYDGMAEVLRELQSRGVKVAVVTNKPHPTACALGEKFFPDVPVFGAGLAGISPKPDPALVYYALEQLGAARDSAAYIGDSEVDVVTAANAGLDLIAVEWGFRDREQLQQAGAERIAENARQLLEMLV